MNELRNDLENLQAEAIAQIQNSADTTQLEQTRVHFLGRKGRLTTILRQLATLAPEGRPIVGALANQVKETIEERIVAR